VIVITVISFFKIIYFWKDKKQLMSENEKDLLSKSKKGDIEAFEKLIEGCQKKVFNIALRIIGNYDDACELSQEVFIRIFKSIKNFKEESSFSTWVYKITTNVCFDELRKQKNKNVISLDEKIIFKEGEAEYQLKDTALTPDAILEKKELEEVVAKAIATLSKEHRSVIVLRDIQGFCYEEIAQILKCPEGTVKSRINRARHELKELLKNKKELFDAKYVKEL
jgi:RNA polymerase sigma-70 factor, ECF subfamily